MQNTYSQTIEPDGNHSVNVARYLKTMARVQPYRRAVVYPAARDANGRAAYSHLTFRQLDRESDCFARGLERAGIGRGIRTILMVRPSLEFFALTFALFKVGAVPVMVDPGMGVGRMLSCLEESRANALIGIPPAHALRTPAPQLLQIRQNGGNGGKTVVLERPDACRHPRPALEALYHRRYPERGDGRHPLHNGQHRARQRGGLLPWSF
jgi:acyl-CoA synthetase (AMP-forming)/AMP-acid ligase II